MKLYFLFAEGCPACEEAKPELDKWEAKSKDVRIHRIDLLEAKWVASWQPQATPTYVLEVPGRRRVMHEGMLSEKRLDEFVRRALSLMGVR
jgi:thiol-disulfide isomerase/thioredoxin